MSLRATALATLPLFKASSKLQLDQVTAESSNQDHARTNAAQVKSVVIQSSDASLIEAHNDDDDDDDPNVMLSGTFEMESDSDDDDDDVTLDSLPDWEGADAMDSDSNKEMEVKESQVENRGPLAEPSIEHPQSGQDRKVEAEIIGVQPTQQTSQVPTNSSASADSSSLTGKGPSKHAAQEVAKELAEEPIERSIEEPAKEPAEQTNEPGEAKQPAEQANVQVNGTAVKQVPQQPRQEAAGPQAVEQSTEQQPDKPSADSPVDNATEQLNETPTTEKPAKTPSKKSKSQQRTGAPPAKQHKSQQTKESTKESTKDSTKEQLMKQTKEEAKKPPKEKAEEKSKQTTKRSSVDDIFVSTFEKMEAARDPLVADDVVKKAASDAFRILTVFATVDPVSTLHEYYQTKGYNTVTNCFHSSSLQARPVVLRHTTFTCPISKETVPCKLPLALVFGNLPTDDLAELTQRVIGKYQFHTDGKVYFTTKRGAKRSAAVAQLLTFPHDYIWNLAKKTAATSPIKPSSVSRNIMGGASISQGTSADDVILVESQQEASSALLKGTDVQFPDVSRLDGRHFASWVHDLYGIGIRKATISYHEVLPQATQTSKPRPGKRTQKTKAPQPAVDVSPAQDLVWKARPTLIRCTIQIAHPNHIVVIGAPSFSKMEARQDAVNEMRQAVLSVSVANNTSQTKTATKKKNDAAKNKSKKNENTKGNSNSSGDKGNGNGAVNSDPTTIEAATTDAPTPAAASSPPSHKEINKGILKEKDELRNSDGQQAEYVYPLPKWSTQRITSATPVLYLYELRVRDYHLAQPSVRTAMPWMKHGDQPESRFGVVFASDIVPSTDIHFSRFDVAQKIAPGRSSNGTNQRTVPYLVEMRKLKAVKLTDVSTMQSAALSSCDDTIAHLEQFNQRVSNYKTYAITALKSTCRSGKTAKKRTTQAYSPLSRGYMFVPLKAKVETRRSPRVRSDSDDMNHDHVNDDLEIDWDLLVQVSENRMVPYLKQAAFVKTLQTPDISLVLAGFIMLLVALCECSPTIRQHTIACFTISMDSWVDNLSWSKAPWLVPIAIILFLSFYPRHVAQMSFDTLRNRIVLMGLPKQKSTVYIVDGQSQGDALAPLEHYAKNDKAVRKLKETAGNEDLLISTEMYIMQRHKLRLSFPTLKLIDADMVATQTEFDPFRTTQRPKGRRQQLVPELVQAFPLPRDMLYCLGLVDAMMPSIECDITVKHACRSFHTMASKVQGHLALGESRSRYIRQPHPNDPRLRSLPSLVDEATTMYPFLRYQRLEFLGDAVLGYFIAMNIFARNSSFKWLFEDLTELSSLAGKNKSLYDGALRLGLSRLVKACGIPWHSQFEDPNPTRRMGKKKRRSHLIQVVQDKSLSDITESLLGTCYLHGLGAQQSWKGDNLVIAIMELLSLPLPDRDDDGAPPSHNDSKRSKTKGGGAAADGMAATGWFRAKSGCLANGYPFDLDSKWQEQLVHMGTAILCDKELSSKLKASYKHTMEVVSSLLQSTSQGGDGDGDGDGGIEGKGDYVKILGQLKGKRSRLLILIALLDDGVKRIHKNPSGYIRNSAGNGGSESNMPADKRIARFRDTVFHVGAYAFQMLMTEEILRLHPDATAGDLNLIRTAAINDDVLTYIVVKNELFGDTLVGRTGKHCEAFRELIDEADAKGQARWKEHNGWMLPGGRDEFVRRVELHFGRKSLPTNGATAAAAAAAEGEVDVDIDDESDAVVGLGETSANDDNKNQCHGSDRPSQTDGYEQHQQHLSVGPRYAGLACGRLAGHDLKVSKWKTQGIMFTFKCFVGSLVLSVGTEGTWRVLGPLFQELLVVSADELRTAYPNNHFAKCYTKGKMEGGKVGKLKNGVFD